MLKKSINFEIHMHAFQKVLLFQDDKMTLLLVCFEVTPSCPQCSTSIDHSWQLQGTMWVARIKPLSSASKHPTMTILQAQGITAPNPKEWLVKGLSGAIELSRRVMGLENMVLYQLMGYENQDHLIHIVFVSCRSSRMLFCKEENEQKREATGV